MQNETSQIRRVLMKHAEQAFIFQEKLAAEWRNLNYLAEPDFKKACAQSDALADILTGLGCSVEWLGADETVGIDSIYVRDNAIASDKGLVLCRMGKEARRPEPSAMAPELARIDVPILGQIGGTGKIEGGDLIWLDGDVLCVADGYRTNAEGVRQLTDYLGDAVSEVITVPLPHWNGPDDVLHLMSFISPVAPDLAVVYSRMMPVFFRNWLQERGIALVEVPDEEYDSMACNLLAVAPRVAVMLDGNPVTRQRLEKAGVDVHVYDGSEISAKGCGGPTCLTRPLERG
ncbi:dimethylarginine dimethylaminohydrolase family protein [Nisaea nitritireducens]|uniref:dimethylarginine dimethylaminohydrolase family protein n=1 Tax=Nisaea nitritireducens TaxID=568392 RepID=UPI001D0076D3|nr:arginine deiminase family protein [Nisaea nitritireducens]